MKPKCNQLASWDERILNRVPFMFIAVKNIIFIYKGDFAGNCISFQREQGIA
jgi:hypothetical protein